MIKTFKKIKFDKKLFDITSIIHLSMNNNAKKNNLVF